MPEKPSEPRPVMIDGQFMVSCSVCRIVWFAVDIDLRTVACPVCLKLKSGGGKL